MKLVPLAGLALIVLGVLALALPGHHVHGAREDH